MGVSGTMGTLFNLFTFGVLVSRLRWLNSCLRGEIRALELSRGTPLKLNLVCRLSGWFFIDLAPGDLAIAGLGVLLTLGDFLPFPGLVPIDTFFLVTFFLLISLFSTAVSFSEFSKESLPSLFSVTWFFFAFFPFVMTRFLARFRFPGCWTSSSDSSSLIAESSNPKSWIKKNNHDIKWNNWIKMYR